MLLQYVHFHKLRVCLVNRQRRWREEEKREDTEIQTRNSQIKEGKKLLFNVIKLKLQLMCETIAEDEKRMAKKSIQNRVRATTNACMSAGRQKK